MQETYFLICIIQGYFSIINIWETNSLQMLNAYEKDQFCAQKSNTPKFNQSILQRTYAAYNAGKD